MTLQMIKITINRILGFN